MSKAGELIATLARKERAERKIDRNSQFANETIEDFIPRVNPKLKKPLHLAPALPFLNAVLQRKPVRFLWSVPPRHTKSWTVLHLIAKALQNDPTLRCAYITHTEQFSVEQSRLLRQICIDAGIELDDSSRAASSWRTKAGGSVTATGVGGPIMGKGFDLVVVDDPYKSRPQVESLLERARIQDYFDSAIATRLQPGASIIVIHTRYSVEDLIGTLVARDKAQNDETLKEGWTYINLPAINDGTDPRPERPIGAALWPEVWPVEALLKHKGRNEFEWASMYQGQPRPRGSAIFRNTTLYKPEELAALGAHNGGAIGIDLAYTSQTYSDYSAIVTGKRFGEHIYITNVIRVQKSADDLARTLRTEKLANPSFPICWMISGVEKAMVAFLRTYGLHVRAEVDIRNKLTKAQAVATAWNQGRIHLPDDAPWLDDFTSEVLNFTGVGDRHDDQVDALASMYQLLGAKPVVKAGLGQKKIFF